MTDVRRGVIAMVSVCLLFGCASSRQAAPKDEAPKEASDSKDVPPHAKGDCWSSNFCSMKKLATDVNYVDCCGFYKGRSWKYKAQCILCSLECGDTSSCAQAGVCDYKKVGQECGLLKWCWPVPGHEPENGKWCCGCRENPQP